MFQCGIVVNLTDQIKELDDQTCYLCQNQVVSVNVPHESKFICNQDLTQAVFSIQGKLTISKQAELAIEDKIDIGYGQINISKVSNTYYIRQNTNISKIHQLSECNISINAKIQKNVEFIEIQKIIVDLLVVESISKACIGTLVSKNLILKNTASLEVQQSAVFQKIEIQSHALLKIFNLSTAMLNVVGYLETVNLNCGLMVVEYGDIVSQVAVIEELAAQTRCIVKIGNLTVNKLLLNASQSFQRLDFQVEQLQVGEIAQVGQNVQMIIQTLTLQNSAWQQMEAKLNSTIIRMYNSTFNSNNESLIFYKNLIMQNSSILIESTQEITAQTIFLNNSTLIATNGVTLDNFAATHSSALFYDDFVTNGANFPYSNLTVLGHAQITSGSAQQSTFLVGSLTLSSSSFQSKFECDIVELLPYNYTKEQIQLLDNFSREVEESELYQGYYEQISLLPGTLHLKTGVTLVCSDIIANALIIEGVIRSNRGFTVYLKQFLMVVYPPVSMQMSIVFQNDELTNAYVRTSVAYMVSQLKLSQTILQMNKHYSRFRDKYTITVMQMLSICNQSAIDGEFGVFTETVTIERVMYLQGLIYMKKNEFLSSTDSTIIAKRILINCKSVNMNGNLYLQSEDNYNPVLEINAQIIKIHNVTVNGPITNQRAHACCGASSKNFGGCSSGLPRSIVKFQTDKYKSSVDVLSAYSGDSCNISNKTVLGGISGGSIFLQAEIIQLAGFLNASGHNGQQQNLTCGGGGAGGSIYINTTTLIYALNATIAADGAGCAENCSSGGAGSAGYVKVEYTKLFQFDGHNLIPTIELLPISSKDGVCKYKALAADSYCQSALTVLDLTSMTCIVPVWEVVIFVIVAAIIISLVVYITACIVSKCRDSVEEDVNDVNEKDFIITEEQLYRDGAE